MRVVVTLPNWSLNGVSTFSVRLVRALRAGGSEASLLVTGSLWRDEKPLPLPADVDVERLRLPRIPTWEARWRALHAHLEARAPCVYLPNHDVMHSVIAPRLSTRVGIVGIAHSDDAQHYEHARRLAPWWNALVGVSGKVVERLRGIPELAEAHIERIAYGVEAPTPEEAMRRRDATGEVGGPLRIVYAGRLEERQKRVGDLLSVAQRLRVRGVRFTLTIAGEGSARAALDARVRAEALGAHVRIVGTVAPDAMRELYRANDVFLLPSAFEGLPLALLEAMGEGCIPVVADVESGIPELVERGVSGEVVAIGDVDGFVDAIARLAGDPERRRRLTLGASAVVRHGEYGVEEMARRYRALFERVGRERPVARNPATVVRPPGWGWPTRLRAPVAGWRDAWTRWG